MQSVFIIFDIVILCSHFIQYDINSCVPVLVNEKPFVIQEQLIIQVFSTEHIYNFPKMLLYPIYTYENMH